RSDTISASDCIGLPSHDDICCRVSSATGGPGSDSEHFRFPRGPAKPFGGTLTKPPRAHVAGRAPRGHPTATLAAAKGRRRCPALAGCRAVRDSTLVAWYRCCHAPRTGGAYDSHHRTAGVAGRTRRRGCVAATRFL